MGSQVWSLLSLGVGLNLVLGALVAAFKLPIYLDSLGTVLVAALAGPLAGSLAGGCGVALLGLTSPTALAFLPVGVAAGAMAGWAAKLGAFKRAGTAVLAGALAGCFGAALAAPISYLLFGGLTGGGTDLLIAAFRYGGWGGLEAAFMQGLLVDPLDKAFSFLLVYALLLVLPARSKSAFPMAALLPHDSGRAARPYHPQAPLKGSQAEASHSPASRSNAVPNPGPGSPAGSIADKAEASLKLGCLLSLLLSAGVFDDAAKLTLWTAVVTLAYSICASPTARSVARRALLGLCPLALSLVLVHGLIPAPGDPTIVLLGVVWSLPGLLQAWMFLARVALIVVALSMFLVTTSLPRVAELLLRLRVPYPLVFVLLAGANLGKRLRDRWRIVEEAQRSRGLHVGGKSWRARWRDLMGLLTPALGALFAELPMRAANLETRGFLRVGPRYPVPRTWTREPEPNSKGRLFYLCLILAAWSSMLWTSL